MNCATQRMLTCVLKLSKRFKCDCGFDKCSCLLVWRASELAHSCHSHGLQVHELKDEEDFHCAHSSCVYSTGPGTEFPPAACGFHGGGTCAFPFKPSRTAG